MKLRFASKVAMFQQAFKYKVIIHVCYNQQTLRLQCKIPTSQIWPIAKIIASTLAPIVSSCVLNQRHGYWLLNSVHLQMQLTFV
jgi:hypothetical protein